jgi:transcriptional antiterminator RfaH
MSGWYAIQTKPRKEEAVLASLGRAGLESYCPRMRRRRRRQGKRILEAIPLFPGYLFVRLQFPRDYAGIRWTPGLVRIVSHAGMPARIGEEVLEGIRRMERAGGLRIPALRLKPGSRVRVVEGPFTGFEGLVTTHLSGGERIRILLELFRRQAALDCDPESLQPIAAAAGSA